MDEITLQAFSKHLIDTYKDLWDEQNFADVTLISDDHIIVKAHKNVISASSPVLKTLLLEHSHSHPLIYLRGIRHAELQAILKFMYLGETQLYEERIKEFASVAKDLKVKNIMTPPNKTDYHSQPSKDKEDTKQQNQDFENSEEKMDLNEEAEEAEQLQRDQTEPKITTDENKEDQKETNKEGSKEFEVEVDDMRMRFNINPDVLLRSKNAIKSSGRGLSKEKRFVCDKCEAAYYMRNQLKRHRESVHEGRTFKCTECDIVLAIRSSRRRHMQSYHPDLLKFSCDRCDFKTTSQENLENHNSKKKH